jgi:hypothetical protein
MSFDWCACCIFTPKYSKHTNQRTFLNITTTGVKIHQAHQSKDISDSCDIQKCPLIGVLAVFLLQ